MNEISDAANMDLTNANILIVDDEPANIMLLEKILATKGYNNVTTTQDSTEVVSLHVEKNFDLILMDINMPKMSGYEVLKELIDTDNMKGAQVVATSANTLPSDVKKGLDSGFADYITKPMRIHALLEIVDKVLQKPAS